MNNVELMLEVNRLSTIEKLQKENKILNDKLGKIEQIVKAYDGSTTSMIKQFSEIQKILEQDN